MDGRLEAEFTMPVRPLGGERLYSPGNGLIGVAGLALDR